MQGPESTGSWQSCPDPALPTTGLGSGGEEEGGLEGGLEGKGEGGLCQEREGLTYREGGTRVFIKWIEFPNRPVFAA